MSTTARKARKREDLAFRQANVTPAGRKLRALKKLRDAYWFDRRHKTATS